MPGWMGIWVSLYTNGAPVSEGPPFLSVNGGLGTHTLPSSLLQAFLQLRGGLHSPSGSFPVYRPDSSLRASSLRASALKLLFWVLPDSAQTLLLTFLRPLGGRGVCLTESPGPSRDSMGILLGGAPWPWGLPLDTTSPHLQGPLTPMQIHLQNQSQLLYKLGSI